jgi:hypothetical protein
MRTNVLKHLFEQPFLVAVSLAAAIHSSWSFSVMFTGLEPQPQFSPAWFAWIAPGMMLAFSVDIGLLSLANQIRLGQRTKGKLLAFAVLSGAMGFLQFLYIAAHQPEVHLGAGIRSEWAGLVTLIRDSAIWILPLLLPTALILFAFSDTHAAPTPAPLSTALVTVSQADVEPENGELIIEIPYGERFEVECSEPGCQWSGSYETVQAGLQAKRAHMRKHKHNGVHVRANGHGE